MGPTDSIKRGGALEHLALSSDGKTLFAAQNNESRNVMLWRWDIASGKAQALAQFGMLEMECIAPSPNGKVLVICPNSVMLRLIDPNTGQDVSLRAF